MEVICASEMPVDVQRTTRHCIPEDSTHAAYNNKFLVILRSRTKLGAIQNELMKTKFVKTELICLLNLAAVALKRRLYNDALRSSELVRAGNYAMICRYETC
jgi:hypothetical protein